jgi:hypothetical protein
MLAFVAQINIYIHTPKKKRKNRIWGFWEVIGMEIKVPWQDGIVASKALIYVLPFHIWEHWLGGSWLRVLTEQKVPGTGVQSVQFQVVKEMLS